MKPIESKNSQRSSRRIIRLAEIKMIKIQRFKLKSKNNKTVYKGIALKIGIFKFERITLGKKFLWRFELSYGWDK